ncbi:MAG: rhodanese-like domain-containing protein [endosymbiont of Escarpia spicata]|uniref:Rhodanese-like domain-containing protein n=1 Tax=endosymbiont of Escarpia spicata TaxID=2200908 RepID=A0A370DQH2_9GAMM|nr:MAG: rhodanese-like domain-containing protein [endosymbiont of Escarpia spicata]
MAIEVSSTLLEEVCMKKLFLLIILSVFFVGPVFSYDQGLAKSYEQYFSSFSGKGTAKALQMIPTKVFVESLKKGEKLFIVDIRTPGETGVYGFNLANSTVIPMNEVFTSANLAKIPTSGKVVIVCKAGHRAMAIATGLRHIGFKNVFVLKHGISDVANFLSPKNAY